MKKKGERNKRSRAGGTGYPFRLITIAVIPERGAMISLRQLEILFGGNSMRISDVVELRNRR